jgi:NitT/TauT family transport system permease protein
LREAAYQSNFTAIAMGVGALVVTIVLLDQLVWRPLIAWSERFKVEMVENDHPPTSWFYNLVGSSRLVGLFGERLARPLTETFDRLILQHFPIRSKSEDQRAAFPWSTIAVGGLLALGVTYGLYRATLMLITIPNNEWMQVGLSVLATLLRVTLALIIALAWTIPVGVAIGTNRRLSAVLQPVVQVAAAVPATALFPVILLLVVNLPAGLNLAAVLLMLMGTQWYLLFNIIAGASAIPQDLKYTSQLMQLKGWERWRTLILPAIFPYLVTGAITASGGAWNASVVAEYQTYGGQTLAVTGIGALIAQSTGAVNYPLLLAATLAMVLTVILINRLLWRRLFMQAEEKYRME